LWFQRVPHRGSTPRLLETKAASEEVPKIQDFQRLVHEAGIKKVKY
jgi:hypothetical protein